MALTEFLRRLVPQFTRDHRIRRGIGSSRRSQRGPTAPRLESLEDRTLLAAVAVDDSYTIDEGTSLRTGGFVVSDHLITEYDASALTGFTDGAAVSAWNDISGNGNTANATQPGTFVANGLGGRPAVDFDLYDNYLSSQSVGTTYGIQGDASWTMVWVANVPVTAPGTRSIGAIGTGGGVRTSAIVELENTRLDVAGGYAHDVVLNPSNSFSQFVGEDVILTFRHDGNTGQSMLDTTSIFVNGFAPGDGPLNGYSLAGTGQGASLPYQIADRPITLGGGSVSVTPGFEGLLSEVHFYNDSLTDDDLQHLEYSLGQKYGIAGGFQTPSVVGLLDNDNPDAGPLSALLVNAPANGSLTLDSDGSISYTPNPGFTGVDTFTYKVNDGSADSNVATVTVTVNDVALNPMIVDLSVAPNPVMQGASIALTANGVSDGDGDLSSVSFYFDSNDNGFLEPATDLLLGTDTDGSDGWQVVATTGAIPPGSATFLAQAVDDTALTSNVASSSALITTPPVAGDDSYTIDEGTSLRTGGFVVSDHLVTEYDASAIVGIADGSPVAVWDDVSGKGNTGNAAQPGTFVGTGVGGRPSVGFASNQQYQSTQNIGSNFGIQGDASWTMVWVANVANPAPGYRWIGGIGSGGGHRTAAGVEIDNNRLDVAGGFANDVVLGPNDSFSQFIGEDVILTFRHDGNTGQSMLDTTSLFVNGFAPGEGPLAGNSLVATGSAGTGPYQLADGPIYVGGTEGLIAEVQIYDSALSDSDLQHLEYALGQKYGIAGGFEAPSVVGLLENDTDASSDPLSALLVSGPANGTLMLDQDGSVLYTPNPGFTGVDTFSYKVSDGTADSNVATVSINVNAQPANPVIASLTATPDPVLQSADLTLTANGVTDPNVNVAAVHFYRDVNNNGLVDTGIDELFGSDSDGSDGWSVTAPAVFAVGTHTFLSQVEDTTNNLSNVVSTTVDVTPSVYWDGGGGDFQWNNRFNWSDDALPGATSDVVINAPGDITVAHNGLVTTVRSLTSEESVLINGGSLKVTQASLVNGDFSLAANSTFTVDGLTASLTAPNTTSLGLGNLFAQNGGVLNLSAVTYAQNGFDGQTIWRATGAGSQIDLSGLTALAGYGRNGQLIIDAIDGAEVDLSNVVNNTYGTTQITARGTGSVIDHSSMTSWRDANRQRSSFVRWESGGVVRLDVLQSMDSVGIIANSGETLSIPSLTNISGIGDSTATFLADGIGSRIELPAVTTMDGSDRHGQIDLRARNGGVIDLPSLIVNTSGTTTMTAFDADSVINVSAMESWLDNNRQRNSFLSWGDGGTIQVDNLETLTSVSVTASNGNVLTFPSLTRIAGVGDSSGIHTADGTGSRLEYPLVTHVDGPERHGDTTFAAKDGGVINLPTLQFAEQGTVNVSAFDTDGSGNGSEVNMPSLISWNNNNDNRESSIRYGRGGNADLSALETLIGVSIYATDGDTVSLPALQAYDRGYNVRSNINAIGVGSRIELPVATAIRGGTNRGGVYVRAYDGATVSLPQVTSVSDGPTNITARGAGSTLEINNLQQWTIGGRQYIANQLLVEDSAVAMVGQDLIVSSIPVNIRTGGLLTVPTLELLTGASLTGDGTVNGNVVNTGGNVYPGSAIGSLLVDGDFENAANGTVTIELQGTQTGLNQDALQISGRALLDGTLQVNLTNGFTPTSGDSFEILQFDSRVCDFLTKNGLDLGGGLHLAAAFDLTSMTLNTGTTPDSGQQCQTIPVLTNVDVGPDPAKAADVLSITFEVDVALLNTPDVTVDGNAAVLSAQNGSLYTFTYTVAGTENEGLVDVVMVATSLDGGVATETVSTELDFTDPVISAITPDQTPADVGTILTVTFNSSEALSNSTEVLIGGQPATRNNVAGYSYSRLLTGDEGLGQVTIEVGAVDLAGNTSTSTGQVLIVSGGFDVNVTGIDVTNDLPTVGETITVTADVHNSGLYDVSSVPVRLSIIEPDGDETFLADTTVPVIADGGFGTISVNLDLTTSGVHVLKLHVDPDNLIPEITELDNIATRSLIVDSTVTTAIGVTGALSHVSIAPARELSLTGTASWLANLNPAGALAGGLVTLSVPGTLISATTYTNSNGDFSLVFASPVSPGDYVANVTVSDVTTDALLVLPFTVTAPAGGVDFSTNNNLVGVSDATPVAGTPVTLSARVFNVGGDDFGGATNVRFYDGGTLISTQSITGLASGASTVVSFTHTFNTPGTHVVTAIVDEDNLTVENNEANNTGTVTVNVLDTIADLSPIDISFSNSTPATTETITLTARVRNFGGTDAANVVVRFFDDGTPLGAAVIPAIAADGGTEFISIQATLSTAGQRSISVVVDPDNGIPETDEDNNTRVETLTVHDPAPDLAVSPILLSNSTPLSGDTIDVSMTVSNRGELAADAFDAEFRKDGVSFGTVRVPGLAAGGTTVVSLPTSFSAVGGHTVSIVLDAAAEITELSETNNSAFRSLQVLATPLSDLRITGSEITLSDDNPATGETVTVTVPIRNVGQAAATAVTAQLRIDGNIVGSAASTPADIAAGQFATWTFDFVAPAGDGFHLLEIVVDEANQIGESDENNNRDFLQFLVGDHPDLVPSGITFSNGSPAEGDVVTISVTVSNDGDAAVGEFLVRILDGSQQIGQVTVTGLAIGASEIVSVPFDTTGRNGLRLIQVIADPGNLVTEVNEGNNLINANLTVASADAIAPVTVATPSVAANTAGWNNTDVDVELSATDNAGGSGVGYLRYSVNGEDFQTTFEDTQTLSFTSEGIYSIRVQAVDNAQNEEPLQTFSVRIDKTAPVVVHSGPFTVAEGSTIVLDGTGSTDGLSGLAQIAWAMDGDNVYDDGDIVTYVAPNGPLTQPVALRVTDLAGNEAVAATQIDVTNVAPTADAGGNRSVAEGATIVLDATGSSDPGSDIVTYAWDLDGDGVFGETGAAAALGDEIGQNPVFDAGALDGPVSRAVTLRVTDSYGAVDEETVTVSVTNVAPAFEAGPDESLVPADNGIFSRINIAFTDPGLADVHTVTVNFGDNTGDQTLTLATGTRTFDLGHTYVAEGQFTVSVSVSDDDGGVATDSFLMDVVLNTAPEAATDSNSAANEVAETAATGTLVGVTASSFDADGDTLVYSLDDTAGGRFRIDSSSGIVTVDNGSLLDGPASHSITVRATDPLGEFATAGFTIAVLNVAPTVASDNAAVTADEGSTAGNSGTFGDVGVDTVAITTSVGTVTQNDVAGTWAWSWDTSDGSDNSQTVTITATDSDGAVSTTTFGLTVNNVAPTVASDNATVTAGEGSTASNSGTFGDVGADTVAITTLVGTVTQDDVAGTWAWSWDTSDGPDDSQTVTITATDSDGAVSTTTFGLTVNNVAPTVASDNATVTVGEGATAGNSGTFGDVGADTVAITTSVGMVTQDNVAGTWAWSWDTSDGPDDSQTVMITATDSDGAVSTITFGLTVNNVAPTVTVGEVPSHAVQWRISDGGNDHFYWLSDAQDTWYDAENEAVAAGGHLAAIASAAENAFLASTFLSGGQRYWIGFTDADDQGTTEGNFVWSSGESVTYTNWSPGEPNNQSNEDWGLLQSGGLWNDGRFNYATRERGIIEFIPGGGVGVSEVVVSEGQTATNVGSWSDPGLDLVTLEASVGTVTQNTDGTWSWSYDTSDGPDNSQTVTITATDSDGAVSATTFGLTVNNVAPTVASDNATVTAGEGSTASNSGTFGDVGADTVAITTSVGTVTQDDVAGTWAWSWDTSDGPDDSRTVTITATDSDGAVSTTTFGLTVNNVAPTVASDNATVTVGEGATAGNSGTFGDVGADTVAITTSVGTVTQNDVTGTWAWSWDTSDGSDNSQTVTITATDSDGAVSTTTFGLTVNNVAPTVASDNATVTAGEGSTASNSGTFGDVGADTVAITTLVGTVTQDDVAGTWAWSWDTSDGPDDSQTVTITATDSDGAVSTTTFGLTVNNVAPTVASDNATVTVNEGATAVNSGTFGDVGADTVAITTSVGTVTQNDVAGTWAWSWDTSDGPDDSQTVTITAADSDGVVSTATFALTVNNVAPVLSDATFELLENSVNGTPVGTMTATDAGDDTIHYSIAGGTGATAFGIDPLSGVITVVDQSQLDFETTQSFTLEIAATDEDSGTDSAMVLINLQNQATISGVVYVDTDQDGQFDADEMGVNDVVVELLDAAGDVLFSTVTQDGGLYFFEDMDAGTYRIRESQPSGVTDGPEQLGSIGGTVVADDLMELSVSDLDASDYNFAEFGQQLSSGDTAGIGFWQNKHGQALIAAGGTALAGWLTDNFGNIFGAEFVGASGADVASFYKNQLFKQKGKKSAGPAKVDAQFMAVAFATFFTSQNLAGTVATGYGFNVSDTGIGTHVFNVGNSGAAFGVDDDTDLTIMQLLLATNQLTDVPDNYAGFASIYDQNGDGIIDSYEAFLRTLANDVFGAIND